MVILAAHRTLTLVILHHHLQGGTEVAGEGPGSTEGVMTGVTVIVIRETITEVDIEGSDNNAEVNRKQLEISILLCDKICQAQTWL